MPMIARRMAVAATLLLLGTACQTTPLDNIWPGCTVCVTPPPATCIPTAVVIDEAISPIVDCNPVRTQHTLVATVLDQFGRPCPGQRVEWILSRYGEAVGDIVASDDQYYPGRIAPLTQAWPGNNGNKIDNQYAVSVTNWGPELLDAGNNYPYLSSNGARLPDITVGPGQSWVTITSTREGVTDLVVYVPGIRDGTKHKVFAKKVWADFDVEFPGSAVNVLPNDSHAFPVRLFRTDGSGIPGQPVEAEILDGPGAVFASSNDRVALLDTNANGVAEFVLKNVSGESGVNRIRLTAQGSFYGETCPRSRIVTKTWQQVRLEISCSFPQGPTAALGKPFPKVIRVANRGDAPAEGVVLEDTPQPGLNIADGTVFPMTLGTLAPGQVVERTVQFLSNAEGTYVNTVRCHDAAGVARAESTCPVEIVAGKLEITKVCDPGRANVGSIVRFVVTVANTGRAPLENVVVVDEYPDGIEAPPERSTTLPVLAPGDRQEVVFTGRAAVPGTYTNTARATADHAPEVSARCTVEVVQCRLEMQIIGPEDIYFGEHANFTLVVTNVGDGAAEGCQVRVTYGGCLGGGFEDFAIGPLAPGEKWTHDWSRIARQLGPCTLTADSSCGASCQIRRDAGLRVTGLTALQLEMVDKALDGSEAGIFRKGEVFIYRLRVENDVGTEGTPDLHITWELPPELEFVSGRALGRELAITGAGRSARSGGFRLGVDEGLDVEIQVRVVSAPASGLVKTNAFVFRTSDGAELASETESTSLKD